MPRAEKNNRPLTTPRLRLRPFRALEEAQDDSQREGIHRLVEVASGSYFHRMRAVGIKTLKNKLSEYVRLAASGETVLVTDRDRVVAELSPPRSGRATLLGDAMLAEAVRKGWVTPPTLHPPTALPGKPVASFIEIMAELDRDREER